MSSYYKNELNKVLQDISTGKGQLPAIVVSSEYQNTKYLTINLESLPAIRSFLDSVEANIVAAREL